jgi:hypothetical protein
VPIASQLAEEPLSKSPIRASIALKDINPDDWKNIPLPLVDTIKAIMAQISTLTMSEQLNSRQTAIL